VHRLAIDAEHGVDSTEGERIRLGEPKGTWTQAPRRSQNAADTILADNNEDKE